MSETCPKCGAEKMPGIVPIDVWSCGTNEFSNYESFTCLRNQLATAEARIAELEEELGCREAQIEGMATRIFNAEALVGKLQYKLRYIRNNGSEY